MSVRAVFIGTTEFSLHMLAELLDLKADVAAVYAMSRDAAGDIGDWADLCELARGVAIECHETQKSLAPGDVERIRELAPDVVFAMGVPGPLPPELVGIPRRGVVASHPALLPENRGGSVISWQILNGDGVAGVTFYMAGEEEQAGPIVAQQRFPITIMDTARTVYDKTIAAGREMIGGVLGMAELGFIPGRQQDEAQATWFPERTVEDGRIDWRESARKIYDVVRASTKPFAGAFCHVAGQRMTVWEAGFSHEPVQGRPGEVVKVSDRGVEVAAGAGLVVLRRVQLEQGVEAAHAAFKRMGVKLSTVLA